MNVFCLVEFVRRGGTQHVVPPLLQGSHFADEK